MERLKALIRKLTAIEYSITGAGNLATVEINNYLEGDEVNDGARLILDAFIRAKNRTIIKALELYVQEFDEPTVANVIAASGPGVMFDIGDRSFQYLEDLQLDDGTSRPLFKEYGKRGLVDVDMSARARRIF